MASWLRSEYSESSSDSVSKLSYRRVVDIDTRCDRLPVRNKMQARVDASDRRTCADRLPDDYHGRIAGRHRGLSRRVSGDYASICNWWSRFRENVPLVVTLIARRWKRYVIPHLRGATMSVTKTENGGTLACWLRLAATREPLFQWGKRQSTSFSEEEIDISWSTFRGTSWSVVELRCTNKSMIATRFGTARYIRLRSSYQFATED